MSKQQVISQCQLPRQLVWGQKYANRLVFLQLVIIVIIASGFLIFSDIKTCYSSLLGGGICCLTSWYFGKKIFADTRQVQSAQEILKRFYKAETGKWLLTIASFTAVINLMPINFLGLFSGYIGAQLAMWFAPLLFKPVY